MFFDEVSMKICRGSPHGIVVYVPDCDIIVSEFKPWLYYYIHFRTNHHHHQVVLIALSFLTLSHYLFPHHISLLLDPLDYIQCPYRVDLPSRLGQKNTLTASLQEGKTPPNECPVYDTKQSDSEVPVMLEL